MKLYGFRAREGNELAGRNARDYQCMRGHPGAVRSPGSPSR